MSTGRRSRWRRLPVRARSWCASPSTATRRRPPSRTSRTSSSMERRRAARRRLPLYRPQAARRAPGLRRGARQVPHQPRQCRLQGQAGPPVRRDHRDRDQARQAGADRRELGLARPGSAHPPDGRERALPQPNGGPRGDARGDGAIGALLRPSAPRSSACPEPHHPLRQGVGGAGPDRRSTDAGARAPTSRCISG